MTLKDRLKGREKQKEEEKKVGPTDHPDASPPNFTFLRTTTHFQEQIQPPSYAGDAVPVSSPESQRHPSPRRLSRFRSSSNASSKSLNKGEGRLSSILHIRSHSRESNTSINVPTDLPEIGDEKAAAEDQEAQWEERATILAQQVAATRSRANTIADSKLTGAPSESDSSAVHHDESRPGMIRHVSDALSDVRGSRTRMVAEAGVNSVSRRTSKKRSGCMSQEVRLQPTASHISAPIKEAANLDSWPSSDLERSTAMFGRLADSNAMAQIMYGLALRSVSASSLRSSNYPALVSCSSSISCGTKLRPTYRRS